MRAQEIQKNGALSTRDMIRLQAVASAVVILIGAIFASQVPAIVTAAHSDILGPRWLPAILAGGLIILGIVDLVRVLRSRTSEKLTFESDGMGTFVFLLLVVSGYVLLIPYVGYAMTTTAFCAVIFRSIGSNSLVISIAKACAVTAVFLFVFQWLLKVQMPTGPLGGIL
jgi:hypothetical protein